MEMSLLRLVLVLLVGSPVFWRVGSQVLIQNQEDPLQIQVPHMDMNRDYDSEGLTISLKNLREEVPSNDSMTCPCDEAISGIVANLTALLDKVAGNEVAIAALTEKVSLVETGLAAAVARTTKLEKVNQIWKANFKIVNRTFAGLRRRFKWIIPVIALPNLATRAG